MQAAFELLKTKFSTIEGLQSSSRTARPAPAGADADAARSTGGAKSPLEAASSFHTDLMGTASASERIDLATHYTKLQTGGVAGGATPQAVANAEEGSWDHRPIEVGGKGMGLDEPGVGQQEHRSRLSQTEL